MIYVCLLVWYIPLRHAHAFCRWRAIFNNTTHHLNRIDLAISWSFSRVLGDFSLEETGAKFENAKEFYVTKIIFLGMALLWPCEVSRPSHAPRRTSWFLRLF